METLSTLLALCAGNSPVTGAFPSLRPVTRSFDVFFDLRLNKRLSKQSWGWWFETPSRSLWRHCNALIIFSSYKERWNISILSPNIHHSSEQVSVKFETKHFFSCDKAALRTLQSVRPSVRPSVRLLHLFHFVPIIGSLRNFQELLPMPKVMPMQKVKVRGQRSRSQRSRPNLAVSGL